MPNHTNRKIQPSTTTAPEPRTSALPLILSLSGVLSSNYVLYQQTLFYHWNVKGPNFYGLHKLFEAQSDELHQAGDVIAERIRALGYAAPGTLRDFIELSSVKEDTALPENSTMMVKNLLESNEICARKAHEALMLAEKEDDEATMDVMTKRMFVHEKAAWMLRSLLPEDSSEQPYPIESL